MNSNKPHKSQKMYPQNQFVLYLTNGFLYDKLAPFLSILRLPFQSVNSGIGADTAHANQLLFSLHKAGDSDSA